MPITFFDLPRELRDVIYTEVLLSPTGYIEPVPAQARKLPTNNHNIPLRFNLHIAQPSTTWSNVRGNYVVSLSLTRTNRQIYHETAELFWARNTLYFPSPPALIHTLKAMGQVSSRLITSIALDITPLVCKGMPKVLRLLASRSRHGSFRRLKIEVSRGQLIHMSSCRKSSDERRVGEYDAFLSMLRKGAGCGFEKVMAVQTMLLNWRIWGGMEHDTIRELHLAWGGTAICNGELEWVDFVHVGKCAGVP